MDDFVKLVLNQFIEENWVAFQQFCESWHGDSNIAEEVHQALMDMAIKAKKPAADSTIL